MMSNRCSVIALIVVLAVAAKVRAQSVGVLLQKDIDQEETTSDLDAAIGKYFVSRSEDDAEEGANGEVNPASDDLDLGQHSGFESAVALGIRFDGIRVSKGRKIKRAFVQFTKDGNRRKADPTELTIHAELVPDADASIGL